MTDPDAAVVDFTAPPPAPAFENGVKDFTTRRDPIQFRIAPDNFAAPPLIGGLTLKKLGHLWGQFSEIGDTTSADGIEKSLNLVAEFMRLLMPGHHGRRFAERLLSDGNPGDPEADPPVPPSPEVIDLQREALPVVYYLMERYGLRPTAPSSESPAGSTESLTGTLSDGISSTAGAERTELTTPN